SQEIAKKRQSSPKIRPDLFDGLRADRIRQPTVRAAAPSGACSLFEGGRGIKYKITSSKHNRRPPERVVRSLLPASENLHTSRHWLLLESLVCDRRETALI